MDKKEMYNKKYDDPILMNFWIEKETKEKLDLICSLKGIKKSDLINKLIKEHISLYEEFLDKANELKKELKSDEKK